MSRLADGMDRTEKTSRQPPAVAGQRKGGDGMNERNQTAEDTRNSGQIRELEAMSGVKLHECYQCGKCAAGYLTH